MKRRSRFLSVAVVAGLVFTCLYVEGDWISCRLSSKRAREASLDDDLNMLRHALQDYTHDNDRFPRSLQDLVNKHYLGTVPTDPCTCKKDWVVTRCDIDPKQGLTGVELCREFTLIRYRE